MHLRSPAHSQNAVAFIWGISLGAFVFLGMRSIAISMGTSIVTSIVAAGVIFWAVAHFGANAPRRNQQPRSDRGPSV
jgi:hypothetical protein